MKVLGVILIILLVFMVLNPSMDSFVDYFSNEIATKGGASPLVMMFAPTLIRSYSRVDNYVFFKVVTFNIEDEEELTFIGFLGQWIFWSRSEVE